MTLHFRQASVVGVGLVTPLGPSREATFAALRAGATGLAPPRLFPSSDVVGEVKLFKRQKGLARRVAIGSSRADRMAFAAAAEAVRDAGLAASDLENAAVSIATSTGGLYEAETYDLAQREGKLPRRALLAPLAPGNLARRVAALLGARGPTFTFRDAADAVAFAALLVARGEVDTAIAGGADALSRVALSNARARGGDPLGEGAAIFVLRRGGGFHLGEGPAGGLVFGSRAAKNRASTARAIGRAPGAGPALDLAVATLVLERGLVEGIETSGSIDGPLDEIAVVGRSTTLRIRKEPFEVGARSTTGARVAGFGAVEPVELERLDARVSRRLAPLRGVRALALEAGRRALAGRTFPGLALAFATAHGPSEEMRRALVETVRVPELGEDLAAELGAARHATLASFDESVAWAAHHAPALVVAADEVTPFIAKARGRFRARGPVVVAEGAAALLLEPAVTPLVLPRAERLSHDDSVSGALKIVAALS